MQRRKKDSIWIYLSLVGQLGFAIITPILLCTGGAYWLTKRFAWPSSLVILGIFLGLGGAAMSFYKTMRMVQHKAKKEEKNAK